MTLSDFPIDTTRHPLLLFDGVCNLCNGFVQFVIKRDEEAAFRFAPLQSEMGREVLQIADLDPDQLSTVVLVENGKIYTHSDVALRVARRLGGLWSMASVFRFIPKSIRDALYNFVAARRYRWFGKKDSCMLPTPELKQRFLS